MHFGSVFSKDNNLRREDSMQNVNKITDGSDQQKNLEELYPEIKQENNRMRQIQTTPVAPEQQAPRTSTLFVAPEQQPVVYDPNVHSRVGIVKNSELERHVVYFIELRPIQNNAPRNLYQSMSTSHNPVTRIEPGELLKVVDNGQDYLNKMRMDRDNQGVWKQVARQNAGDPTDLYVYYDWKNFDTVLITQSAVELDILVPRDMSSVPVFTNPGPWTWKDCQLGSHICMDRIDHHTEAFLLDTSFTVVNDMRTRQNTLQLFYKIGYRLYDKEGVLRHKIGWVPSYFSRRKISVIPKNILSANEYGFSGFETDEERVSRLEKYYVFENNMFSENRLLSRWLKKRPGEKFEVFDNTFAYDFVFGYQNFSLEQSFLDQKFTQHSALLGLGIYAPLYVDLEVQGTFALGVPISYTPADDPIYKATPLFRGDQWLMYTTPIGVNDIPIKFGLGLYYLTMFQSELDFGFKSFVGFQGKLSLENERFWADFRFGPTGQDLGFELSNREIGGSLGIRLDSSKAYESMTIFLDYSSTTFKSGTSGHTTDFTIFNVGIRKSF